MPSFRAHGKLLLTGEYLVIHGALALALPTRLGQTLDVSDSGEGVLHWVGRTSEDDIWLDAKFSFEDFSLVGREVGPEEAASRLTQLLGLAREANPEFLNNSSGIQAMTRLEFPRDWGLGSSSTLVHLIAQWAEVDPFPLQEAVFGGSGYDIACAGADGPILFKRVKTDKGINPVSRPVSFSPAYSDHLHFVHLGKKQDSRVAISSFEERMKEVGGRPEAWLNTIVHQTIAIQNAGSLQDFISLLIKHEEVVGAAIGRTPIRLERFQDFPGAVKSLGAWGGDFVLAASTEPAETVREYFASRDLTTFVPWHEMILSRSQS